MPTKAAIAAVYVREIPKGSGRWYVEVHWHGKRKATRCESKTEAKGFAKTIRDDMKYGRYQPQEKESQEEKDFLPTVREFYQSIFKPNHVETLTESTAESYEESFRNRILPVFQNSRIDQVSAVAVDDFLAGLVKKGLAKNTIRVTVSNAHMLFELASKRELIMKNPFSCVGKSYKNARTRKKIDYLKFEEVPVFLEAVEERFPEYYDFFATAIYTGAREGELKGLQWGDFQIGDKKAAVLEPYVTIQRSINQYGKAKGTKTGYERTVPLANELIALLVARKKKMFGLWNASGKDEADFVDSWVFPNSEGKTINGANLKRRIFRPVLQAAELRKINFHALRHTFASLLLQSGKASLLEVSRWLGHRSISLTADVYGHLEVSTNRKALNALPRMKQQKNQKVVQFKG